MPLLLLQDTVIFPLMRVQLTAERSFSVAAVQQALEQDRLMFLTAQRENTVTDPDTGGLCLVGTILINSVPQDNGTDIIVQGVVKAKVTRVWHEPTYKLVSVEHIPDIKPPNVVAERALVRMVVERFAAIAVSADSIPQALVNFLQGVDDPAMVAFSIAANIRLAMPEAQSILETVDPVQRLQMLLDILTREAEVVSMQNQIKSTVDEELRWAVNSSGWPWVGYMTRQTSGAIGAPISAPYPDAS
jgi:ATP-dependent Lon protease